MKINKKNPDPVECPNNNGVACMYPDRCETCGWNPDVARARAKQIREELKK